MTDQQQPPMPDDQQPPSGAPQGPPQGQPHPGQPHGGQPGAPYAAPQYQQTPHPGGQPPLRPDEERNWAAAAHFGPFLVGFLAPLIVYMVYKDRSPWLKASSTAALNFNLSWMIWIFVSIITIVGWIVVIPAYYVLVILGGVKSMNGEIYKYPLTIQFVK